MLVNGGLNLSTLDGWWAEAYDAECGWALGDRSVRPDDDVLEAAQLYSLLERNVVPEFYDRDAAGFPRRWIARMRASMARLAPHFSGARMVQEYIERLYVPAAASYRRRAMPQNGVASNLDKWSQQLKQSVAVNEGGIGLHRTAVDTEGNILVVWVSSSSVNALRAARFAAHEEAWTPADVIPASTGSSDVRVVFDRLNNATVVWRWSQADSAPGLKSTQWLATQPPRDLFVASLAGNLVTLHWTAPNTAAPTGYVLEGGLNPGEVLASIPTNSAAPTFTFVAPTGAFYIRVRAVTDSSRSVPSNEIRIFVNVPVVPSAPANLLGLVNGTDIALSWNNTFAGGAPTSLWLTVHGPITTALPLPMGEAFSYANVPLGTYTLSVVAANASGVSAPSNEVTLTIPDGCSGVPAAPMNVQTWKVGTTIFLSWDPPALGPAVTSYTVAVTGAYFGFFETPERSLSGAAPPGSYALSVMARNVCGAGPRTLEQTVEVP